MRSLIIGNIFREYKRRYFKRGYFFLVDALVGSAIIFISLLIILNYHSSTPPTDYDSI